MWPAVRASWVLRCDAVVQGLCPQLTYFVQSWVTVLEVWVTHFKSSLYREEGLLLRNNLIQFLQGKPMFVAGVQTPLGAAVQPKQVAVPKAVKWQHMLPDAIQMISDKASGGWDVAFCDESRNFTAGILHAGFSVWFGPSDERNSDKPVPVTEKQTITRAELRAALLALDNKLPGTETASCDGQ